MTRALPLSPFDVMRATRALAPHDARLNDLRWMTGEALRQLHARANADELCAPDPERIRSTAGGAPISEARLDAQAKLAACEREAGLAAWPILRRIVVEFVPLRDCRAFVSEVVTPWRVDAIVADRLRVALDRIAPLFSIGEPR